MGLDIRLPIGAMFTLFGLLLTVFGLVGDKSVYQRSLGMNVNLGWGVVLLVFPAECSHLAGQGVMRVVFSQRSRGLEGEKKGDQANAYE